VAPYFDFNQPYQPYIRYGKFSQAVDIGLSWLAQEKATNSTRYDTEPKGTPFYWLGIAAFACHDYQTATFLFDAAVSEDLRYHSGHPDTPALLFMRLDENKQEQAALPIVKLIVEILEKAVNDYIARKDSDTLTAPNVRENFLKHVLAREPHLRSLTTALVSFFAEWGYRLKMIDLITQAASREAFFTHLFRGCLLFESLLKENPAMPSTAETLVKILKLGSDISNKLGIKRKLGTSSDNFDDVVLSLKPRQQIVEALECTVQTRNTLGHNLAWLTASLDGEKYDLLAKNIAASCLHVISRLYR
jgi:hypothetical protein